MRACSPYPLMTPSSPWPRVRRSPGTSRRSSSRNARSATSPARSRRCRSSPTRTRGSTPGASRRRSPRALMPPWHIDKSVGIQAFKNDRSLSDQQIATLVSWVDNGTPLGSSADMPPAPKFPDPNRWQYADQFGAPDIVLRSKPFDMAGAHAGQVVPPRHRDRPQGSTLGSRHRDQAGQAGTSQGRPPRPHPARAAGRPTASPTSPTKRMASSAAPASSWNGPSARSARSSPPTPGS